MVNRFVLCRTNFSNAFLSSFTFTQGRVLKKNEKSPSSGLVSTCEHIYLYGRILEDREENSHPWQEETRCEDSWKKEQTTRPSTFPFSCRLRPSASKSSFIIIIIIGAGGIRFRPLLRPVHLHDGVICFLLRISIEQCWCKLRILEMVSNIHSLIPDWLLIRLVGADESPRLVLRNQIDERAWLSFREFRMTWNIIFKQEEIYPNPLTD